MLGRAKMIDILFENVAELAVTAETLLLIILALYMRISDVKRKKQASSLDKKVLMAMDMMSACMDLAIDNAGAIKKHEPRDQNEHMEAALERAKQVSNEYHEFVSKAASKEIARTEGET